MPFCQFVGVAVFQSLPTPILNYVTASLVPRPLPDFISQPWRKIGRRTGTNDTDWKWWTRQYVMWTRFCNDGKVPTQYTASTASKRILKFA